MLLAEDNSAPKVAPRSKFHGPIGYKLVAYIKKQKCNIMNEKNSTSFWGDTKEIEHLKKVVSYENNDCYLI